MTLVDTNILLDLVTDDPAFADWSIAQLEAASLRGPLIINDIIYAELSARYETKEALDEFVAGIGLEHAAMPNAALFLAAKAFLNYKTKGGQKGNVLPDFFIGAHGAIAELPILTRDPGRYRTYYPTVELITP